MTLMYFLRLNIAGVKLVVLEQWIIFIVGMDLSLEVKLNEKRKSLGPLYYCYWLCPG
jgi:hypothetical protein